MKNIFHTKGQNLTETFSYNSWNMLDNHTVSNANADVYDMSYNYSRGWHLIEKADGIKNTSDKYTYDSYYRLKGVDYDVQNNVAARTDNFYQDGVHNIEQSTENGTTFAWGVDKLNRLRDKKVGNSTESAYEYDERNNMISEDRSGTTNDRTYIYDDLNRLIEVKDGSDNTIATYTYDAFNRRITKTVGSTTERYTYDDWNIVEISTNSNDYANIIDFGTDRHIAIEITANNTSTLYYFLTDERGNVTALTDANGNVLERYRYRVYGDFEILDSQFTPKNCNNQTCYATSLHNFLWGGSLYEPETNLYWMRNRYYHIDMHRFINQDPIGIWGDANNLGNGFAYVAGMVIEASDSTGLEEEEFDYESPLSKAVKELHDRVHFDEIKAVDTVITNSAKDVTGISAVESSSKFLESKEKEDLAQAIYDILSFAQQTSVIGDLLNLFAGLAAGFSIDIPTKNNLTEIKRLNGENFYQDNEGNIYKKVKDRNDEIKWYILKDNREWEECEDPSNNKDDIPYDPNDDDPDKLKENILRKMLQLRTNEVNGRNPLEDLGSIIKYEDNGRKVFIFNPYYRGKDPLKEIIWEKQNADGTKGFVRNPFAPGAEYGYDSTTYQKWQNKGFIQTNVDPYFK